MPSQMQRAAGEETERNIDNDSDIEIINTHEDTNTAAITDCDCMNCSAFGSFFFAFQFQAIVLRYEVNARVVEHALLN